MKTITTEDFIKQIKEINPTIKIIGEYVNSTTKIQCQCVKCGFVWDAHPSSLRKGHGCRVCGHKQDTRKRTKTKEEFIYELSRVNPRIEVIGEYKTARTPIKCICKECGYIWKPIPDLLLRKRGCPSCSHASTSFLEQFILLSFQSVLGKDEVISRDRALIGKEIDIYIPSLGIAIEPGSWHWHKNKVDYDLQKRKECKSKNVRLIIIYDGYKGNLIPTEDDYYFQEDLGELSNRSIAERLVLRLFEVAGLDDLITSLAFEKIEKKAFDNAKRKTTDQFINEMKNVNSRIRIIGEYKKVNIGIDCLCLDCGHTWNTTPSILLNGAGCPECTKKRLSEERRKSHSVFIEQVSAILPSIEVVEEYRKNNVPISCKCTECGNVWKALPMNLIAGHGCRVCAMKKNGEIHKKTNKEFEKECLRKFPTIKLLSNYNGVQEPISLYCTICGNTWKTMPGTLMNGNGCPNCRKRERTESNKKLYQKELLEKNKNKDIDFLSDYSGSNSPIICKCRKCSFIWKTTPHSLNNGAGCPECARKRNTQARTKAILMYTKDGVLIKEFESAEEASKETGIRKSSIHQACRGDRKTLHGYLWKHKQKNVD